MVYKPYPECGEHNHHNKSKYQCAESSVCLHTHIYYCATGDVVTFFIIKTTHGMNQYNYDTALHFLEDRLQFLHARILGHQSMNILLL